MVKTNNDVVKIREMYEKHALEYVKSNYEGNKVTLLGHTKPGKRTKDIQIIVENGYKILIEVKGTQLLDKNGGSPRWQRIKLNERDYAGTEIADFFLIIFDTSQLGMQFGKCSICNDPECSLHYQIINSDTMLNIVPDQTKRYARISLLKLFKELKL